MHKKYISGIGNYIYIVGRDKRIYDGIIIGVVARNKGYSYLNICSLEMVEISLIEND